jgi:hypothetical protein
LAGDQEWEIHLNEGVSPELHPDYLQYALILAATAPRGHCELMM